MSWYMFQLRLNRHDLADKLFNSIRSLIDRESCLNLGLPGFHDHVQCQQKPGYRNQLEQRSLEPRILVK